MAFPLYHLILRLIFAILITALENSIDFSSNHPNAIPKQPQIAHSFAVADVEQKNFTRIIQSVENATKLITEHANLQMEFESGMSNINLIQPDVQMKHGLIATALMAYNHHQALAFSPDDFWLLIAQGIAQHIGGDNETAESYRKLFVDHEGKKNLIVDATKYRIYPKRAQNRNGWPPAISEMGQLIRKNTKTEFSDLITNGFSTTKGVEKTVFTGTLMETMKNYFSYKFLLACGIPKIFLLGMPGDYQEILNRIDKLKPILTDFHWYLDRVRAIMVNVSESANGNVDTVFWNQMIFEERQGSGSQKFLTGWLGEFIPYIYNSRDTLIQQGFDPNKHTRGRNEGRRIDFDDFNCPAASLTDAQLIDLKYTFKEYDIKVITGFLGPAWDDGIEALRPAMGWAVGYVDERPIN